MKRSLLIIMAMLLLPAAMSAQRVIFKVGGGLASHYGRGTRSIGALKLGAAYEHELTGNSSIEPGLFFYVKGYEDKDERVFMRDNDGNIVNDDDGNPRTGIKNSSVNANYIEIPVPVNYYLEISPLHYIEFSAGPYVAWGVGGKRKTRGDTDKESWERFFYTKKIFKEKGVHRFDAGITTAVSYEFNRRFAVGVEADFGLANFNTGGAKNLAGIISFSYRLRTGN